MSSSLLSFTTALPDYAQFSIATLGTMFSSGTKVIRGKDWKWGNQDSLSEGMVTLSTNTSNSPGWVHATFVTHQNSYRVGAENAYDLWRVYGKGLMPCAYANLVFLLTVSCLLWLD